MMDERRELLLSQMLEHADCDDQTGGAALNGQLAEDESLRAELAELVEMDRLLRYSRFLEAEQPDLVAGVLARQRCLDRNSPRFGAKVISRVKRERRRGRPPILAGLFAAAAVIAAAIIFTFATKRAARPATETAIVSAPVPVRVAEVGRARSGTRVLRESTTLTLEAGMPLYANDCIETAGFEGEADHEGEKGNEAATIVYPDRTEIVLSSATRLSIAPANGDSSLAKDIAKRLELVVGTIEASVAPQPPESPMTIVTPHASVTVIGTAFLLSAASESTTLEVEEGTVRFARLADGASTVVPAGFGATAAPGVELAAARLGGAVLYSRDFENGRAERGWLGRIQDAPPREGSRFVIAGMRHPKATHTEVKLVDKANGLFTHRKGAVVSFEYWVGRTVRAIDVIVWDRTRQASLGAPSLFELRHEEWTRASFALDEFRSPQNTSLDEGNLVVEIRIITNAAGGTLLVDDVEVALPARDTR